MGHPAKAVDSVAELLIRAIQDNQDAPDPLGTAWVSETVCPRALFTSSGRKNSTVKLGHSEKC